MSGLSRRGLFVAAAALTGAGCGKSRRRPGRLTYLLRNEPVTFDPAKAPGGGELWILAALFEPLLQTHPQTMEPIAGLATHHQLELGGTRYTFYLRGHPRPRGVRLADRESLGPEFSRGQASAAYNVPARWSDGRLITAHDVVYSWRRYVAPETGFSSAYYFHYIRGAEDVNSGKRRPEELAVRALDDFALQVDLRAPAPDFLSLCCTVNTLPMPRHAIEEARRAGLEAPWTEPGRMVTSGPFVLSQYRPRERTIATKNPGYFDAALVCVDEIEFAAADGVTVLNLFRAGTADSMEGRVLPLQLTTRLRETSAFHVRPAFANHNWRISTKRPPLHDVRLRWALNMATDKAATVRFLGTGQTIAKGRVPPFEGYRSPQRLPVEINGRVCDILAYDPGAARELWASAAPPGVVIPIHYFARVDSRLLTEILQRQWRDNLGLRTALVPHDAPVHIQTNLTEGDFSGVAEDSYFANYADPYDLLGSYTGNYPNWSDPEFDRAVSAATSMADPKLRLNRLAECEAMLLRAMPFVPVDFDTWVYLERPEVHGLALNPLGIPSFKYAWIDTTGSRA